MNASADDHLSAEVVVIGSGPGGSVAACVAAEAGRGVVLMEEGPALSLDSCSAFSRQELEQKYRNGGLTVAFGRPKIAYVEGRCVGGGSEINSGLVHRTPSDVLERWQREFGIHELSPEDLSPHFASIEKFVGVSDEFPDKAGISQKLRSGAATLGWDCGDAPRCGKSVETELAFRRSSMTETYIPRALAAGAHLVCDTRALRIVRRNGRWRIHAESRRGDGMRRHLVVDAKTVVLACGAIHTPLLLRRSGYRNGIGNTLKLHVMVKVLACFPEEINGNTTGVAALQVREFFPRFSLGCSISTPPHLALALLDHAQELRTLDECWRRMANYYAMISGGNGTIRRLAFMGEPFVRYRLSDEHLCDLSDGLRELCRALLAAGAESLYPNLSGQTPIRTEEDLTLIPRPLPRERTHLTSVHLMGSCPMGEGNRRDSAVNSYGELHGAKGLYVADASLFCDAPGVNPQGTIMALVRRNTLHFLDQQ